MNYTNSPYNTIPIELVELYTCNNKIPILEWYIDGTNDLIEKNWTDEYVNNYKEMFSINNIKSNTITECYSGASLVLLKAFEQYSITNKNVAVIGSISPWIEAILLNLNNNVTTVEYNVPNLTSDLLKCISYWDFQKTSELYDCIVTYSSIEHSGLGRYGDPLDPEGDIKCMKDINNNIINNGILIWGAPVGHDALVWNAHRIYGKIRLPMVFENFEELTWIDYNKNDLLDRPLSDNSINPVVVLKKK